MSKKQAKKLDELFHDTLKDIYFAEKKILTTFPKMEKAAQAPEVSRSIDVLKSIDQVYECSRGESPAGASRALLRSRCLRDRSIGWDGGFAAYANDQHRHIFDAKGL